MRIRVFDIDTDGIPLPLISSDARLVVWPGTGAEVATMNYVVLQPGEANVPHAHPESEDTIYILEGSGTIEDFDSGQVYPLEADCVAHVDPGTRHAVTNTGDSAMRSVGGPCPPDWEILRRCGVDIPDR